MKKSERIELGRKCVEKMLNDNLTYKELELVEFDGEYYGKDALKKYMEAYIEKESMENPDNPVIEAYEAAKKSRVKVSQNKITADKILSKSVTEFKNSLGELSNVQIQKRLKVLQNETKRTMETSGYINAISEYLKEKQESKQEKSYLRASDNFSNIINYIIDQYINSPVIEINHLRIDPNVMPKKSFLDQLRKIEDEIKNGGDNYTVQVKSKVSALLKEVERREDEAKDEIILIANYIINGIPKNGVTERFTLFDYYTLTSYSVPDLALAARKLSAKDPEGMKMCANTISAFRDKVYTNDFRVDKDHIIKYQYTESGRVLFGDEIDAILNYLKVRNIPVTQKTYQGAYHEYVNGRLQIKQI